jgi:hypothetical protein
LLDPRGAPVGEQLLACDRLEQRGGYDEPSEPERRSQRLAERAGVHDAVGVKALERADRRAVVAVLGVVVVLDRDRARPAQPGEKRLAPFTGEHDTRRMLVRGREHHRIGVGPQQLVQPDAAGVDPDADRLKAGADSDHRVLGVARGLERNAVRARRAQRAAHQTETLRVAASHDDPIGIRDDATDAAEVRRERRAQRDHPRGSP